MTSPSLLGQVGRGLRGLPTAVRFLTILPFPGMGLEGSDALGRSAGWFPVVGLALGGVLWVGDRLLSLLFPPVLATLLVLATWKLLTGGIHLDGLADSLDGMGGRDPAARLAIMRDSRVGVFGALGLVLALLLGLAALAELPNPLRARALLLAPAVGRLAPLLLSRTSSPATPGRGSGAAFILSVRTGALAGGAGVVAAAGAAVLWPWGLVAAAAGTAAAWTLVRLLSRRLGGLTGDSLGAGVELGELGALLAFASLQHLRLV